MARPGTPYPVVKEICNRLAAQDMRPSYSLVAAQLDGNPSKKTILEHIEQWRNEQKNAATVPGISETAVTAFKAEIAAHVQASQEGLEIELAELKESKREALEALEATENLNTNLENELQELKDQLAADQQDHEKTRAGLTSTIENLTNQVENLQAERDQLITSGEAARTEAARAQLQLDQTVKAVASAEKRETELNKKIERLTTEKIDSEKTAAVAAARVEELREKTTNLKTSLDEIKKEYLSLETTLNETRKEVTTNALLIKDADKRAAVAEQKANDLTEKTKDLKISLDEATKRNKELEKKKG